MGLDISAYRNIEIACELPPTEDEPAEAAAGKWFYLYTNTAFPGRADGLKDGYYRTTQGTRYVSEYRTDGPLTIDDDLYGFSFRAGSYSGYSWWRDQLASLVGVNPEKLWETKNIDVPFGPLINFSDAEGTIGPVTSARLAKEFDEWRDRANAEPTSTDWEWFLNRYERWSQAFHLASQNGAVLSH